MAGAHGRVERILLGSACFFLVGCVGAKKFPLSSPPKSESTTTVVEETVTSEPKITTVEDCKFPMHEIVLPDEVAFLFPHYARFPYPSSHEDRVLEEDICIPWKFFETFSDTYLALLVDDSQRRINVPVDMPFIAKLKVPDGNRQINHHIPMHVVTWANIHSLTLEAMCLDFDHDPNLHAPYGMIRRLHTCCYPVECPYYIDHMPDIAYLPSTDIHHLYCYYSVIGLRRLRQMPHLQSLSADPRLFKDIVGTEDEALDDAEITRRVNTFLGRNVFIPED